MNGGNLTAMCHFMKIYYGKGLSMEYGQEFSAKDHNKKNKKKMIKDFFAAKMFAKENEDINWIYEKCDTQQSTIIIKIGHH